MHARNGCAAVEVDVALAAATCHKTHSKATGEQERQGIADLMPTFTRRAPIGRTAVGQHHSAAVQEGVELMCRSW
jgi:hypothetical protein